MTENILQCCYTNAVKETGGKISSGWQAVVVSEDLPSEAYAACVNLQNANSTLQSHAVDERGNVLNLFEITGDGAYVYVSRTQYGLTDRLGRPNMFSHAYIFSWKREDVISDPNVFLTLREDNFAKDEETARQARESLDRFEPFTLERALECAGMTAETYLTLIRCVYAQYSERKATKPVYVQYDGTEKQMQAILYCIYVGIPYCMRRNLSIASAAASMSKSHHLIFSVEAARYESFVVPQTGENKILTPRVERRIARCGFVEHAAAHYQDLDMDAYFQQLEKLALELGDPAASDELILRIAHQLLEAPLLSELTNEGLGGRLSDALRSKSYGSQRMEEYISSMLDEVCNRKMSLTEENEANLAGRLTAPVTGRLADAGERYNIYRLSTLPVEDAANLLHRLSKPVFDRYSQTLAESGKGLQILDHYYAAYGLAGREFSWEALDAFLTETSYVRSAVKTRDVIDAAAWKLYDAQLEKPDGARSAYTALMNLMGRLLPPEQLHDCGETAKISYWEKLLFQSFTYRKIDEYRAMQVKGNKRCDQYMAFYAVLAAYDQEGEDAFFRELHHFAAVYDRVFTQPARTKPFLSKLEEEMRLISPQSEALFDWIPVVSIPDAGPVLEDILELRNGLRQKKFATIADAFQQILESIRSTGSAKDIEKALSRALAAECRKADRPDCWIPIDVWLALGASFYPGNAFQIFDDAAPCVLCIEETRAVGQSRLLSEASYIHQAEVFAQGKSKSAKVVHKWLGERKAIERRRRADERKTRREADGSVLDRGRAFLSQLASSGEARSGRRISAKKDEPAADRGRGFAPSAQDVGEAEEEKKSGEKRRLF